MLAEEIVLVVEQVAVAIVPVPALAVAVMSVLDVLKLVGAVALFIVVVDVLVTA